MNQTSSLTSALALHKRVRERCIHLESLPNVFPTSPLSLGCQRAYSKASYIRSASLISLMQIYSSAECERLDCPGPSLNDGKDISAWSLRVGEPKGVSPSAMQRAISGWSLGICDECRRKEWAFTSERTFWQIGRAHV